MENLECCGRYEDAEFAHCQSQITDVSMDMFSSFQLPGFARNWPSFEEGFGDDGTAAASSSKSHSEAEKRRRDRINGQLQTLKKLIPKSEKMDKAALLASVIEHVKDLKSKAAQVSKVYTVPNEVDEVRISTYVSEEDASSCQTNIFIEASLCCEDRPELFAELDKALQSLNLSIVQAQIASLGCRIQIKLLLSSTGISSTKNGDSGLTNLKTTLRGILNRVVNSTQSVTSYRVASKRHRFFMPRANN